MDGLRNLFHSAMEGREIPAASVQAARSLSNVRGLEERVLANSVLFLAGGDEDKLASFASLREICEAPQLWHEPKAATILLLIVERFSSNQLQDSTCFAEFAFRAAAQEAFLPMRVNAMRVLRRFAKLGNPQALELLRRSLKDPVLYVREAAAVALKLVGPDAHP